MPGKSTSACGPKSNLATCWRPRLGWFHGPATQLCLRPRLLGAAIALHQLQMPHRAIAVIVPAAKIEIWHRDFPVYLVEPPCPPVWMRQPVSRVLRQPRRQVARKIEPRQVVEPLFFNILVPFLQRLRWRMRRRQSLASPKIRSHRSEPPLDAPSPAEIRPANPPLSTPVESCTHTSPIDAAGATWPTATASRHYKKLPESPPCRCTRAALPTTPQNHNRLRHPPYAPP